jgi:hypothetical protein
MLAYLQFDVMFSFFMYLIYVCISYIFLKSWWTKIYVWQVIQ